MLLPLKAVIEKKVRNRTGRTDLPAVLLLRIETRIASDRHCRPNRVLER